MRSRDIADLLLLAALWGASFLFMRVGAPQFGPVPMMALRAAIGAAALLPLLLAQHGLPALRLHARPIAVVGVINSALPFSLFAFATLSVTAGFASILNATAPFWGAIVAYAWLREKLSGLRIAGLVIGFGGVLLLVWGRVSFQTGGSGWAILAALLATFLYGVSANYTRVYLPKVDSLAAATGSQLSAAIVLAPFAWLLWPAQSPGIVAWLALAVLGVFCTGLAYILYFRLIRNVGATKAIAVTFLIPVFGMLWGTLFLDEALTVNMLIGSAVILLGTALTTDLLQPRPSPRPPSQP